MPALPSISDLKRIYFANSLGVPITDKRSVTDLERAFYISNLGLPATSGLSVVDLRRQFLGGLLSIAQPSLTAVGFNRLEREYYKTALSLSNSSASAVDLAYLFYTTFNSFVGASITNPTQIANCSLWLDAGQITGSVNGVAVGTWNDLSGAGNSATQTLDITKQPIFRASGINGKPSVEFDASNDGMTTPLTLAQTLSAFYVGYQTVNAANQRVLQGSANWLMALTRTDAGNKTCVYNGGGFLTDPGATYVLGTPRLHSVVETPSSMTMYVNGVGVASGGNPGAVNVGTLALAAAGGLGEPMGGYLSEVIVYTRALIQSEIDQVHAYLKTKYGIP